MTALYQTNTDNPPANGRFVAQALMWNNVGTIPKLARRPGAEVQA